MLLINQRWEPVNAPSYEDVLDVVSLAASTCYKGHKKTKSSKEAFVRRLIKAGHTSTIEHVSLTFQLTTDRAVSHELVRHRIASYSQESQRYCAYHDEIAVIKPHWYDALDVDYRMKEEWYLAMKAAEGRYHHLLEMGMRPEDARGVLPNATATTIVCTFNFRSLLNFFNLRTAKGAHPDIRRFANDLYRYCEERYPAFFDHRNA